ncbi:hypothetical protein GW17_00018709 [Ensete ventricosum]|nr:hypothetical protein GW17_00018709 [Ensete ventricosum]
MAKVFVRKIGFKLRVMRLNRVELFYAFLLHFCSEGNEEGLAVVAAKAPYKGADGQGQPPPPPRRGGQPAGVAASDTPVRYGRQRLARKRLPSRGSGADRRGGRPLVGRLSIETHSTTACAGVAATAAAQEGEVEG